MRKHLVLVLTALFAISFAGTAQAGTSYYGGTLQISLGDLPSVVVTGIGVASLNGTAGGSHVYTITIADGDIAGTGVAPVTDPDSNILSVRLTATVGAGDLAGIGVGIQHVSASTPTTSQTASTVVTALTNTDLGLSGGLARICVLVPGCGSPVPLALGSTHAAGTTPVGVGIGGQLVVPDTVLRVSVDAAPWTILTATVIDMKDAPGPSGAHQATSTTFVDYSGNTGGTANFTLKKAFGFAHGPASAVSTVALGTGMSQNNFGVLQFVTPTQVTTNITSTSSLRIGTPISLAFRIVPEPGLLLLLGSGVAGLVLLGRHRMRK